MKPPRCQNLAVEVPLATNLVHLSWRAWSHLFLHVFLVTAFNLSSSLGQTQIAIPGNPKGDLNVELLQSVTAVRSMEATLQRITEDFPSLRIEALAALSSWQYSPFARGAKFIEDDIKKKGGEEGRELLAEIDKMTADTIRAVAPIETLENARKFIRLVERRAKGGIEVPMVRGNLLWNCPEYQSRPEKEILDGYFIKETSTKEGVEASVEWPMSWKPTPARNAKILQKLQSHWGHGKFSGMLRIDTIPLPLGTTLEPDQVYEEATQESMQAETKDMRLLSFKKTKLNGRPVILTTSVMEMEQLSARINMVCMTIYAYHSNICSQLTLMLPASPTDDPGDKLKKHEPLFLFIANSFRVRFGPESGFPSFEKPVALSVVPPTVITAASPVMAVPSPDVFEMYLSKEFGFAVKLPKEVVDTKAPTPFGTVGNVKAFDESRSAFHSITVNRIDTFVEEDRRGSFNSEGVIDSNFNGWTKQLTMLPETLKSSNTRWAGHEAIRYSFQCDGLLKQGVTTHHRGVTFLHKGCFYNLQVFSLVGDKEAVEDLATLETNFMIDGNTKVP